MMVTTFMYIDLIILLTKFPLYSRNCSTNDANNAHHQTQTALKGVLQQLLSFQWKGKISEMHKKRRQRLTKRLSVFSWN